MGWLVHPEDGGGRRPDVVGAGVAVAGDFGYEGGEGELDVQFDEIGDGMEGLVDLRVFFYRQGLDADEQYLGRL